MIRSGRELTKLHEGYVEGIYLDTEGHPTCGYGTCLDPLNSYRSVREYHEAEFARRYAQAEREFHLLGLRLDEVRRAAVVDMLYNLGLAKLRRFRLFIEALVLGDFAAAGRELERSRWYRQVGRRAVGIRAMIEYGTWEPPPSERVEEGVSR